MCGSISKRVTAQKSEYELYMMMLPDSLPIAQYKALKAQVNGMETKPSKATEIQVLRKDVQVFMKAASIALERNRILKYRLGMVLRMTQTPEDTTAWHKAITLQMWLMNCCGLQKPLPASLESMRCKFLDKWKDTNILETEKKDTMVYDEMEVERNITEILDKLRITQENQRHPGNVGRVLDASPIHLFPSF
ncbi:unnamed protein product, partial [Bubo scandiacus]